jgi:STE24 endopeptidase
MAVFTAILVYAMLRWFGRLAWLASGLGLTFFGILLTAIAPVLVFPLFYRFQRLPPGDLPDRLQALAERAGAPVLGVYSWSLGDKSRTANAALVGIGPTRRILLSDTLIAQYSTDEIEVIIAHELAHHVHGDIWKGVVVEAVQITVALLAGQLALLWGMTRFALSGVDDVAGMPLLALAAGTASVVTAPLVLALSRRHERRADRFALDLTRKADAFISAMRRLGDQNLADAAPTRAVEWLFHSHPPLQERITAARDWSAGRA